MESQHQDSRAGSGKRIAGFWKKVARRLKGVSSAKNEGNSAALERETEESQYTSQVEDDLEVLPLEPPVFETPSPKTVSLQTKVDELWSLLMKNEVGIFGIHCMAGVGKTTLLKIINNKAISTNEFDIVIWIIVTQKFELEILLERIGRSAGFSGEKWKEKSVEDKVKAISIVLCKKKFLLFLDDIWEGVDSARLGVPYPGKQNESKIIFTTCSEAVCRQMGAQEKIAMAPLPRKEAWELFQQHVGTDTLLNPETFERAKLVAESCCGVPLSIIVTARSMAGRWDPCEWERRFRKRTQLRWGQSLFLEEWNIQENDLINLWISQGLFSAYCDAKEATDLGQHILETLKVRNLFEEVNNGITVHDLIRDMAVDVARNIENLRGGRFSSMENILQNVAEIPPALFTCFQKHNPLILMKGEFAQFIGSLIALDLSNSGIESLPQEISKFASLQHLNLSHTWIHRLPVEFKMLTKLRCLNVEHSFHLRVIGLSSLKILKMFRCGFAVEAEEDNIMSANTMDIDPLLHLHCLDVLGITITCVSALQKFLTSQNLMRCTQWLSLEFFWRSKSIDISRLADMENLLRLEIRQAEHLQNVDFGLDHGNLHRLEFERARSFNSLQEVSVANCASLRYSTWVIQAPNLTILRVIWCEEIEEIISTRKLGKLHDGEENLEPFQRLEILALEDLPNLKSIYGKPLPFQSMKRMKVVNCPILKKLPLNYDTNSANKGEVAYEAEEDWWKDSEWDDDATITAFLSCFKPLID